MNKYLSMSHIYYALELWVSILIPILYSRLLCTLVQVSSNMIEVFWATLVSNCFPFLCAVPLFFSHILKSISSTIYYCYCPKWLLVIFLITIILLHNLFMESTCEILCAAWCISRNPLLKLIREILEIRKQMLKFSIHFQRFGEQNKVHYWLVEKKPLLQNPRKIGHKLIYILNIGVWNFEWLNIYL